MSSAFPEIYLVRHGETEWSASGKHTGRTDIPLTAAGEAAARTVAERLKGPSFQAVWSSPSQRADNTCTLAGFGAAGVKKDDLQEWDYGAYEGLTTKQILAARPGWNCFATAVRAARWRRMSAPGPTGSSAGCERPAATCWCFPARISCGCLRRAGSACRRTAPPCWCSDTASLSTLGYEHDLTEPVIRRWNQK